MAKLSDDQQRALAGLLGLGDHSARKSHYPELTARLDELEAERKRYIRLNDELERTIAPYHLWESQVPPTWLDCYTEIFMPSSGI